MTETALIDAVRRRFAYVDACPVAGERAYFENAGGALTLHAVVETSARYAALPDNQGRDNPASAAAGASIAAARDDLAALMNPPGGQFILGESGTELLFRLIRVACLAAPRGANVIGSTLEHPASRSAAQRWSEIAGLSYRSVTHDHTRGTVGVDAYRAAVDAQSAVATVIHTSPVTGMGVDVAAVVAAIRERSPDCLVIVDGIQHAAHGAIDLAALDVDGYVISPYKMFSRHGYGLAWLSDRLAALPHDALRDGPPLHWELGTRDTGAWAALSDVVAYLEWLGGQSGGDDRRARLCSAARWISARERQLCEAMLHGIGNCTGLAELPGVTIIGGDRNPAREGLVSLWVEGQPSTTVVEALRQRGLLTHTRKADHYSANILAPLGRSDCVRISLCHYNSEAEIEQLLSAMAEIIEC